MAIGFCTKCGFEIESFDGLICCPNCKTKSIPCDYTNQVNVSINIHELKILCTWSERWVMAMKSEQEQANSADSLRGIVSRLKKQLPEKVKLLLSDEIGQLKKEFDVDTNMTII